MHVILFVCFHIHILPGCRFLHPVTLEMPACCRSFTHDAAAASVHANVVCWLFSSSSVVDVSKLRECKRYSATLN